MKLEYAMECLRNGQAIWRRTEPQKGYLLGFTDHEGTITKVFGSFYLTIYDVLAEDWTNEPYIFNEEEWKNRD